MMQMHRSMRQLILLPSFQQICNGLLLLLLLLLGLGGSRVQQEP
jgi:hypothetical protein